jgi:glutamate-1-semialdehyde 2,1-aminomutase
VSAGLAAIRHLQARPEIYDRLDRSTGALAACAPGNVSVNRVGSMMTWFFTDQMVIDAESAKTSNIKAFGKFFHAMLERGIYLPPSQYEALFVSAAHTDDDIDRTINAARESFAIALS